MKKRGYMVIFTVAVIILAATILASAGGEEEIVKDLIKKRTDILSDFYAGRSEKKEAIEAIEEIEGGHLLKEDLQNINLYFQTDIEQTKKYDFEEVIITNSDSDIICADVTILWEAEGLSGSETFEVTYNVICELKDDSYKLVQFF